MKEKIITMLLCSPFLLLFILNVWTHDETISISERRKLAQVPTWSIEHMLDQSFMKQFDAYASDQMVGRDVFRSIKTNMEFSLFHTLDVHGLYQKRDAIFSRNTKNNHDSISYFIQKIKKQAEKFQDDANIYVSIIPEKSYYLHDEFTFLQTDELVEEVTSQLHEYTYLDSMPYLDESDYYRSDVHWKQECIEDVAQHLVSSMQQEYVPLQGDWQRYTPFYGIYYRQLGLSMKPDTLSYLKSQFFDDIHIFDVETQQEISVYNEEKLYGYDPYEIFLSGSKPILKIENPKVVQTKELVIFRDSFASSLLPYIIPSYSAITVIDLRYVQPEVLNQYVTYENQDVLFLYSTTLINQSSSIK